MTTKKVSTLGSDDVQIHQPDSSKNCDSADYLLIIGSAKY